MRLLHSGRSRLTQTTQPQRKFVPHLLGLLRMLPGHATLRNMRRDSPSHARTFARWSDTPFAWVACNKVALTEVGPSAHAQAFVIDASVVPKSGKHTYGLDRFGNGSQSRPEKGRAISTGAWLARTGNCASCRGVAQTPPRPDAADAEATRMEGSLDQLRRGVEAHAVRFLRDVLIHGAYSHPTCVAGVVNRGMHHIGTLRAEANVRYLSHGPKHPGRGRPKTYDGQVSCRDRLRFARLDTEEDHSVWYLKCSITCSANATSTWGLWSIPSAIGLWSS